MLSKCPYGQMDIDKHIGKCNSVVVLPKMQKIGVQCVSVFFRSPDPPVLFSDIKRFR